MKTSPRAFTLIELLTVIAIIGVLASIIIATVGTVREKARGTRCLSNLRQIGTAQLLYANENNNRFTPTWSSTSQVGWLSVIGPYLGTRERVNDAINNADSVLNCPARANHGTNTSSYGLNYQINDTRWARRMTAVPNPSRTILAGDQLDNVWNEFVKPPSSSQSAPPVALRHSSKANMLFCDGHVRSLSLQMVDDRGLWWWW